MDKITAKSRLERRATIQQNSLLSDTLICEYAIDTIDHTLLQETNIKLDSYYDISLTESDKSELYEKYKDKRQELENEFSEKTRLNKTDIQFLFFAIALQVVRQYLLTGELGKSFDKDERMTHDDPKIKETTKEKQNIFSNKNKERICEDSKRGYRSWKEIAVAKSVPYDASNGSAKFAGGGFFGTDHRARTLGHDPILGWIFGTFNILTDTMTLNNLNSYNVNLNGLIIEDSIFTTEVFRCGIESITEDWYRLPAAIFAQGLHLKSDEFTKMGLPVPFIQLISAKNSLDLYKKNYDSLCFSRDVKAVGNQALFSLIINTIISVVHSFYYDEKKENNKKLYEIKTRKILLYSNAIASASNILHVYMTQNIAKLDLGGLIVTVYRIVSDIKFMDDIKKEFLNTKLSEHYQEKIDALDFEIEKLLKELNF